AALMMASCVLLGVEARLAKTDAMLLLSSVAAMGAFARIYLASHREPPAKIGWQEPAILWTAIAAGVLLKGPLILMFVGLSAITLCIVDRSPRWLLSLRPVTGLVWLLLLVSPWFLAIMTKSGASFVVQSIGHDLVDKVTSGQETHGAPPGFYLLLFWVTFWPGAVLAGLGAAVVGEARHQPGARFLLAWRLPSWVRFCVGGGEAAALRPAPLSRHCYSDRRHSCASRPIQAALDGARHGRLASFSGSHRNWGAGAIHRIRPRSRSDRVAVFGGRCDLRFVRLVALCSGRRRAVALPYLGGVSICCY